MLSLLAGGYDKEEKAARAYDLAALKYRGTTTTTNFPVSCHLYNEKTNHIYRFQTEGKFLNQRLLLCVDVSIDLIIFYH